MKTLTFQTRSRDQLLEITAAVQEQVKAAGVSNGVCHVHVPHTTAGITLNENCDPDVLRDILVALDKIVPQQGDYRHAEGNSPAHVKTSLMGSHASLFVEGGRLVTGTWQGLFLAEFDGPRERKVIVRVIG